MKLYAKNDPNKTGPYVEVDEPKSLLPTDPTERRKLLAALFEAGILSRKEVSKLERSMVRQGTENTGEKA